MRPQRIELEGFGSFRAATTVDLADADLFVLSGATGAGKTTIVDAVVFALYGTVPRYEDRRLVAPVVNQSRNEARVRLTFTVGHATYQATRVVRRRDGGATTKEARLEDVTGGGHRTLAGTADELTAEVQALLGLTFEQFTRSVVLPQGAFDRFLFAKPSDRADLLVQLLDLGVYDEVGRRARSLAANAEGRVGALSRRLEDELADATSEARAAAAGRVDDLRRLAARCDEVQPELDAIRDEGARLRERAEQAGADRDALATLVPPDGLDELVRDLAAATAAVDTAETDLEQAAAAVESAGRELAELPDPDAVGELQRLDRELADLAARRRESEQELAAAREAAATAEEAEGAAAAAVTTARAALQAAHRDELAQTLAHDLEPGDRCPVCGATVDDLPDHPEAAATARAQAALEGAERDLEAARRTRADTDRRVTAAETTAGGLAERADDAARRRDALRDRHALPHDADELAATAAAVRAARDRDRDARRREQDARARRADEKERLEPLDRRVRRARDQLDQARQRVARLTPPQVDHDDLPGAWAALLAWVQERRPAVEATAREAQAAVDEAVQRYRDRQAALAAECRHADVDVPKATTPPIAVARALSAAEHELTRIDQRLADAATVRRDLAAARDEQAVAATLGRHLRADGFERWLLSRALRLLVAGASTVLRDLSSGAYSLALDDTSQFQVVDHRNADEPRTVRSLSGGERFLASLALALALADHVAELAAEGAARLESLFLDEGFGTLDADTLDVVAAAIEELGSRGRMVGVITHVRDLADRLPVRFEVRRDPTGSTVRRLDAATEDAATEDAA